MEKKTVIDAAECGEQSACSLIPPTPAPRYPVEIKRPKMVTACGFMLLAAAVPSLSFGIYLLFPLIAYNVLNEDPRERLSFGIIILTVELLLKTAILFTAAIGLFKMARWARMGTIFAVISASILSLAIEKINFDDGADVVVYCLLTLAIYLTTIITLTRPAIVAAFRER